MHPITCTYHGTRCHGVPSVWFVEPYGNGTDHPRTMTRPLSPYESRRLRDHSPGGFEWGYAGSGPAQLALALLLHATGDPEAALDHYQRFKISHVANWGERWQITADEIRDWVAALTHTRTEDTARA